MFKRKPRRSREWHKNNQVIDFEKARERRKQKRKLQSQKPLEQEMAEKPKITRRKAGMRNRRRNLYATITLIIVLVIGFSAYNIISARIQHAEAQAEENALKKTKAQLEEELSHVDNPEYVEQQARTVLRMIMPGEILYVIPVTTGGINGTPEQ